MAFAETAKLVVQLALQDKLTPGLKSAAGGLSRLGKSSDSAWKSVAKGTLVAGAVSRGVSLLGDAIGSGIDSAIELENAMSATRGALASIGGAAGVSAQQVRDWSVEVEDATNKAVDDKAIERGADLLIRYGKVGGKNLRIAMQAAADLGVTFGDTESAASALAKALADPTKATRILRQAGVTLTKAEQDKVKALVESNRLSDAQALILQKVTEKTKGAAAASAGPYQTALNKLRDAAEDAKIALATALLPSLTKVADLISKELAKPGTLEKLTGFGRTLARFLNDAVSYAQRIPWDTIASAMQLAGQGAKAALDFFNGLPDWVKTAVITGWGLNKLTGGALGSIVGELGKGLIKGVLNMSAAVVNLKAGTVTGGGGGGTTGAGGGLAGKLGTGLAVVGAVTAVAGAVATQQEVSSQSTAQAQGVRSQADVWLKSNPTTQQLTSSLAAVDKGIKDIQSNPLFVLVRGDALAELQKTRAAIAAQLADQQKNQSTNAANDRQLFAAARDQASKATAQKATADKMLAATQAQNGKFDAMILAARATTVAIAAKKWAVNVSVPVSVSTKVSISDYNKVSAQYAVLNRVRAI